MSAPFWYRVKDDGPRAGEVHLAGWDSLGGLNNGSGGYLPTSACPVCRALVPSSTKTAHEQWHARTDCPIPDDLMPGWVDPRRVDV